MKNILLILIPYVANAFTLFDLQFPGSTSCRLRQNFFANTDMTEDIVIEPKEAVKLFGRLADKYIMLDESAGKCCYSGCTGCEFRLPEGGYRMPDQTASRPKWIVPYENKKFESSGKDHTSKWSLDIFSESSEVTKDEFLCKLQDAKFLTPLGGPFLSASAGKKMEDTTAAEKLFHTLACEKETLTKCQMSKRLNELAGGDEGLTWKTFESVMIQAQ